MPPVLPGNSMTGSERPSPEPLLKKRGRPHPYWGDRILEMLWSLHMPWIIGFGGPQSYSRGEFQEKLWERFRGLSGISSGKSQPYWGHGPNYGGWGLSKLFASWREVSTFPKNQERKKHINIKKYPKFPQLGSHPKNSLCGVSFLEMHPWRVKQVPFVKLSF